MITKSANALVSLGIDCSSAEAKQRTSCCSRAASLVQDAIQKHAPRTESRANGILVDLSAAEIESKKVRDQKQLAEDVWCIVVFGFKWYQKGTSQNNYWTFDDSGYVRVADKYKANLKAKTYGGVWASYEYRDALQSRRPFLVVTLERVSKATDWYSSNICFREGASKSACKAFCLVTSEEQLFHLYNTLPPADRYLEEVVTDRPHKIFFDIERDFTETDDRVALLAKLREGLTEHFIPITCSFLAEQLGIGVQAEDFFITDSSKLTSKFSVHVTISTPSTHYFKTRVESWAVMIALLKVFYSVTAINQSFKEWLFYYDKLNNERTIIDFSIYGKGARNMRLLGCCKSKGMRRNVPWTESRVFVPADPLQGECAYHHYFVNVIASAGQPPFSLDVAGEPIVVHKELLRSAIDFCASLQATDPVWFRQSKGFPGVIASAGCVLGDADDKRYAAERKNAGRFKQTRRSEAVTTMAQGVRQLSLASDELEQGTLEWEMQKGREKLHGEFFQFATDYLEAVANIIYPDNSITNIYAFDDSSLHDDESDMQLLVKLTTTCLVPEGGRRCFAGCRKGAHSVTFSLKADFSVSSFCFGCSVTAQVLPSPFRENTIVPRVRVNTIADDFMPSVVDYSLVPHGEGEDATHMRRIKVPMDAQGRYEFKQKSTIILHGGMGTGKTVAVQTFLADVTAQRPQTTIVAFSFRKMLASMFAHSFGLENYCDVTGSLHDCTRVAMQIESLERLGIPDEREPLKMRFRGAWDIIVLDEVESLLQHFSSSTMKDRMNTVWQIFASLVRLCNTLIVCDADIGERTLQFLRKVRGAQGELPNFMYHLNRHNAIRTRFIDYSGVGQWVKALEDALVRDGKNIFVFSNNKGFLKSLLFQLMRDLNKRCRQRVDDLREAKRRARDGEDDRAAASEQPNPADDMADDMASENMADDMADDLASENPASENPAASDDPTENGEELPQNDEDMQELLESCNDPVVRQCRDVLSRMLLIDADIPESEKKKLSRCNEEWVKYRVVFISPTVGAGIDFTVPHFHKSFGYCIHGSCSARGINQMRGRCRNVIDGECHLYVNENKQYDGMDVDAKRELAERNGIAIDMEGALAELENARESCRNDQFSVCEELDSNNGELVVMRIPSMPRLLQTIVAINKVEENLSRTCFRAELITVLRNTDPNIDYTFLTKLDLQAESCFKVDFFNSSEKERKSDIASTSVQREMNRIEHKEAVDADMRGVLTVSPPDEDQARCALKNSIMYFYGIKEGLGVEDWQHVIRICAKDDVRTQVMNFSYILGGDVNGMYSSAVGSGALKPSFAKLVDHEGAALQQVDVPQRSFPQLWPQRFRLRIWAVKLLYAAGFVWETSAEHEFDEATMIIPVKAMGHLCEARLAEEGVQAWLNETHLIIKQHSNISNNKENAPGQGEAWEWKHVSCLATQFLLAWFNLVYFKSSAKESKKKRARREAEEEEEAEQAEERELDPKVDPKVDPKEQEAKVEKERVLAEETRRNSFKYRYKHEGKEYRLQHIDPVSLKLMLSLSYCYLNAKQVTQAQSDEQEHEAAKKRVTTCLVSLLAQNNGERHTLAPYTVVPAPKAPEEGAPAQQEEEQQQQQQQQYYQQQGDYCYGGMPCFNGNYTSEEEEEEFEEKSESGESALSTEEGLSVLRTSVERKRKRQIGCAVADVRKAKERPEQIKQDAIRMATVTRFCGGSIMEMAPLQFAALVLSAGYQQKIRGMLVELKRNEPQRVANLRAKESI